MKCSCGELISLMTLSPLHITLLELSSSADSWAWPLSFLINRPPMPLIRAAAWKHVIRFPFSDSCYHHGDTSGPACLQYTRDWFLRGQSSVNPRPACRLQPTHQLVTDSWAGPAGSLELPSQWPMGLQKVTTSCCFKFGCGLLTQRTDTTINIYPLPGFTSY